MHLAAISNDPIGDLNPDVTYDINHRASVRLAEEAKKAGVPRFIFSSSCSLYGAADGDERARRDRRLQPRHALRRVQGARRARHHAARRRHVHPDLPAQRDRLRRLPAHARRPGRQQPRRLRLLHRRGADAERRQPVAAARPHRGHLARVHRRARGAARRRPQRGLQRRPRRGQPPDPRHRRHGRARSCPDSTVSFAPGASPDKRSYRVSFAKLRAALPGLEPRWTVEQGVRGGLRGLRRRRPGARRLPVGALHAHQAGQGAAWRTAGSTTACAGGRAPVGA